MHLHSTVPVFTLARQQGYNGLANVSSHDLTKRLLFHMPSRWYCDRQSLCHHRFVCLLAPFGHERAEAVCMGSFALCLHLLRSNNTYIVMQDNDFEVVFPDSPCSPMRADDFEVVPRVEPTQRKLLSTALYTPICMYTEFALCIQDSGFLLCVWGGGGAPARKCPGRKCTFVALVLCALETTDVHSL